MSRKIWMAPPGPMLLLLAGCGGVLDPRGPVAHDEVSILGASLAVMLCTVVPTILAAAFFAWWFRASNGLARRRPNFVYSGRIELVVWSVPLLTIMFLGGIAWIGSHRLDPYRPLPGEQPLEVQVVALDWKWLFIYPGQGVASVNRLVVPVGNPVHFRITSASVMNSFFVPKLGSMIYAMNGMATQLSLQADAPGRYPGLSTHFSGDGFADMRFDVDAVPRTDFARWAKQVASSGPVLDRAAYNRLAQQSQHVAPHTYRAAAPRLFDAVVMQAIAPAPGPDGDTAGPPATTTKTGGR